MGSHHDKATKEHRTRASTITKDESCRLEESNSKPYQRTRKMNEFQEIRETHNSAHPPPALETPPERG
jgi:hypothetical protein